MRLTAAEVEADREIISRWTNAMQFATKKAPAPEFALKGPCQLNVRKRPTRSGAIATVSGRVPFMGGEKFNLASVSKQKLAHSDEIQIDVSFVPADMAMIGAISGMSMSLSEAIDHFEGFEDWVFNMKNASSDGAAVIPKKAVAKSPAAERAENPMWGSW